MDIAVMFEDVKGYKYFLLFVDVFSSKVFAVPLKSREINEILKALKVVFANFKAKIYEIQSDREPSFISKKCKDFFRQEQIVFRPKFGQNKAQLTLNYLNLAKK